jgi:hypothetical protein
MSKVRGITQDSAYLNAPAGERADYDQAEAEALGNPVDCLNCGKEVVRCEDADCWHHGNVEPYVHEDGGSHYCYGLNYCRPGADVGNMVAEVDR